MKQIEKWNNRFIILALVAVASFVVFLAIRNDARFNDSRNVQASEKVIRDSLECERIDCLSSAFNNLKAQLDSIKNNQKMGNGIVGLDIWILSSSH